MTLLAPQIDMLKRLQPMQLTGTVRSVRGLSIEVDDLPLPIGSLVTIKASSDRDGPPLHGEVVGFSASSSVVMLLGSGEGISPGVHVIGQQTAQTVQTGSCLLGRVIDGLGRPIDDGPNLCDTVASPLHPPPTGAMTAPRSVTCSWSSSMVVPCPAMMSSWLKGGISVAPVFSITSAVRASRPARVGSHG